MRILNPFRLTRSPNHSSNHDTLPQDPPKAAEDIPQQHIPSHAARDALSQAPPSTTAAANKQAIRRQRMEESLYPHLRSRQSPPAFMISSADDRVSSKESTASSSSSKNSYVDPITNLAYAQRRDICFLSSTSSPSSVHARRQYNRGPSYDAISSTSSKGKTPGSNSMTSAC